MLLCYVSMPPIFSGAAHFNAYAGGQYCFGGDAAGGDSVDFGQAALPAIRLRLFRLIRYR